MLRGSLDIGQHRAFLDGVMVLRSLYSFDGQIWTFLVDPLLSMRPASQWIDVALSAPRHNRPSVWHRGSMLSVP